MYVCISLYLFVVVLLCLFLSLSCHVCICVSRVAFAGFRDGDEVPPGTEPDPTPVDVIIATDSRQQWVALECALNPGSTPKPIIEWVQRDGGVGGTETVLEEDFTADIVGFLDDGQDDDGWGKIPPFKLHYCFISGTPLQFAPRPFQYFLPLWTMEETLNAGPMQVCVYVCVITPDSQV